jgi:hypothetical protein
VNKFAKHFHTKKRKQDTNLLDPSFLEDKKITTFIIKAFSNNEFLKKLLSS